MKGHVGLPGRTRVIGGAYGALRERMPSGMRIGVRGEPSLTYVAAGWPDTDVTD